jgi:hypothetical protein
MTVLSSALASVPTESALLLALSGGSVRSVSLEVGFVSLDETWSVAGAGGSLHPFNAVSTISIGSQKRMENPAEYTPCPVAL